MKKEQLMKVRKSVELCNQPADDKMCKECPYYKGEKDYMWTCMDDRNKDIIGIINWGIRTVETLEGFLQKR